MEKGKPGQALKFHASIAGAQCLFKFLSKSEFLSSTGLVDLEKPAVAQHRSNSDWWLYVLSGVFAVLAVLVGVRARIGRNPSNP